MIGSVMVFRVNSLCELEISCFCIGRSRFEEIKFLSFVCEVRICCFGCIVCIVVIFSNN